MLNTPDGMPIPSNAPGKFLVSAPEHGIPKRARGYLITDQAVQRYRRTARRQPAPTSTRNHDARSARRPSQPPPLTKLARPTRARPSTGLTRPSAEDVLWLALCMAPDAGSISAKLMSITGMSRPTLYRHLQPAREGWPARSKSAGGRWRA